jgi:hypothetical protein
MPYSQASLRGHGKADLILMPWLVAFALLLIVAATAAVQFWAHLRTLDAHKRSDGSVADADSYRPMLRLLSEDDGELPADPALRSTMQAERRVRVREYLRALTADYGSLLAGVRLVMAQSDVDRPDLAKALVRNRVSFAVALCRIDLRLRLQAVGIGRGEVLRLELLGLVDALDVLRRQFAFIAESAVWGA